MGNGMDKILPGIYIGSIRDSRDMEQIKTNSITHILTIHEDPKDSGIEGIKYLRFKASDHASQDVKTFFVDSIDFIHNARLENGNVLVHCLAGVSRSVTLVIAYIMTVLEMPWYDAMNSVRGSRKQANPNFGFQRQLQSFEYTSIKTVRANLFSKYGEYDKTNDLLHCKNLLEIYKETQQKLYENSSNNAQQVGYTPVKKYPLAYNVYNLDEEKSSTEKQLTKSDENKNTSEKLQKESDQLKNNEETSKDQASEKEAIVQKIFG